MWIKNQQNWKLLEMCTKSKPWFFFFRDLNAEEVRHEQIQKKVAPIDESTPTTREFRTPSQIMHHGCDHANKYCRVYDDSPNKLEELNQIER